MIDLLRSLIKNKSVLILGFGREGKSTLKALLKAGEYKKLAISDMNPITLEDEDSSKCIELISGEHYQKVLNEFDIVFKSPGIVLEQDFSEYKCEIVSQTEIFFRRYSNQIVGITGTKGKSTVATLAEHILKTAGVDTILAGNIGIPVFDIADRLKENTVAVIELSCHQLEYMKVSPHIGVLLNIYEEHLDHYGTVEKYVATKLKIYENQKEDDILICNIENVPDKCNSNIITAGFENKDDNLDISVYKNELHTLYGNFVIPEGEISLLGEHNYYNIGIVYVICKYFDISDKIFLEGLKTYKTLPHRLQLIGEVEGVKYYDDSISTACETTMQALLSLKDADTVIIGGMDRGINYEKLEEFLSNSSVNNIILMEATGKRILDEININFNDFNRPERLIYVEHLDEAVEKAKKVTLKGKSCVMSPAAASYGIFKNFEERGEYFSKLVKG